MTKIFDDSENIYEENSLIESKEENCTDDIDVKDEKEKKKRKKRSEAEDNDFHYCSFCKNKYLSFTALKNHIKIKHQENSGILGKKRKKEKDNIIISEKKIPTNKGCRK